MKSKNEKALIYSRTPERRACQKTYREHPEIKARIKKYHDTPEAKARAKEGRARAKRFVAAMEKENEEMKELLQELGYPIEDL